MLTGIFSLIDTLLNRNLVDILNDLPLTDAIQEALLGTKNDLYQVLSWSIKIEHLKWELEGLNLPKEVINQLYIHASNWALSMMEARDANIYIRKTASV